MAKEWIKQLWRYAYDNLLKKNTIKESRLQMEIDRITPEAKRRLKRIAKSDFSGMTYYGEVADWVNYEPTTLEEKKAKLSTLANFVGDSNFSTVTGLKKLAKDWYEEQKANGVDFSSYTSASGKVDVNEAYSNMQNIYSDIVAGAVGDSRVGSPKMLRFLNWHNKKGLREFESSEEIANKMFAWKLAGEPDRSANYKRKHKGVSGIV